MTARPWGENVQPTAEQLADYMEACTREERVEMAAAAILSSEEARACFIQNHVSRIATLEHEARYFADAAWLSENVVSWSIEMDPHGLLYENRETYLREHVDEDEDTTQSLLNATEASGHLWEVRCYPDTPVGFLLVCADTATEAVNVMRTAVEAQRG